MNSKNRDKDITRITYEFQSMTVKKIARLYGLEEKNCQRLLRKLCKADYLRKMVIPSTSNGRSPNLYYLGNKGAELLGVKPSKPKLNYEHTHMQRNIDVMIDIILGFKETDIECTVLSEHMIRTQEHEIIPDGAIRLKRADKSALFMVECDYGTEILRSKSCNHSDLDNKFCKYLNLFEKDELGYYENQFSQKFKRFRVLLICNDWNRLSAISHLITDKRYHFVWLTTLSALSKKSITGNIWYVPSLNKYDLSIT